MTITNQSNGSAHPNDYTLQYIVNHLIGAERLEDALLLITPSFRGMDFRERKLHRFGSDLHFLKDIEIIIDRLEQIGGINSLPIVIRCSLIHSFLKGLTHHAPPYVLSVLIKFGEIDRAIDIATVSPDEEEKVAQFLAIADAIKEVNGKVRKVRHVLQEALRITRSLSLTRVTADTPDQLRAEIAKCAARLDWEWCEQILGEIKHPYIAVRAKLMVVTEVAEDRNKCFQLISEPLREITLSSHLIFDFAKALGDVARHDIEVARSLLAVVRGRDIQDFLRREIAKQLLESNHNCSALVIAKEIENPKELQFVIGSIAGRLAGESIEEALSLLQSVALSIEDERYIIDFIKELSPRHAHHAYDLAIGMHDEKHKCFALGYTAQLFARFPNISEVFNTLDVINDIVITLPESSIVVFLLSGMISEVLAELALLCEEKVVETIVKWPNHEKVNHLAYRVCQILVKQDMNFSLRFLEFVSDPYLKGLLLAQAIFRLTSADSRIQVLKTRIQEITVNPIISKEQSRYLQAYLIASDVCNDPGDLLSLWVNDEKPDASEGKLKTKLIIGKPTYNEDDSDGVKEVNNFLINLALDVSLIDLDRALTILRMIRDVHLQINGLKRLAQTMVEQHEPKQCDGRISSHNKSHLSNSDIYIVFEELAIKNLPVALRIADYIPDRSKQSEVYAAIAMALKDGDSNQATLLIEKALKAGQIPPVSALVAPSYLELDTAIPEEKQKTDLIQKAFIAMPVRELPGAIPELNMHTILRLAAKGKEDVALNLAKNMSATHAILEVPKKVQTLLQIAEFAIGRDKVDIAKEALTEALNTLQLTAYALPALPRLASLMRSYDQEYADWLFERTFEIAMDREMNEPYRYQILCSLAYFQAPHNPHLALRAARNIIDVYERADALLTIVASGQLSEEETDNVIDEAKVYLSKESSNALAKSRALLKLIDSNKSDQHIDLKALTEIVQVLQSVPPAEWFSRVEILCEIVGRLQAINENQIANGIFSEAMEIARNDPFHRYDNVAQVAKLYLDHDVDKLVICLFEMLQIARTEGYDAVWTAIRAIISIIRIMGNDTLVENVYIELSIADDFLSNQLML